MKAISLTDIFIELVCGYINNQQTQQLLWADIERYYKAKSRHYHTLNHLRNMYEQLLPVKEKIEDWDTVLFALFYHDIIYGITVKDNEEKSAAFAEKALSQIGYPESKIERCRNHIIATKSHLISPDSDTNYFTDADLSILGAGWPEYEAYTKAIRKEYSIYPDLLYKPGRRKVLQHFLGMGKIYKTEPFQSKLEANAITNIRKELSSLS